jgi:hypothetical protein
MKFQLLTAILIASVASGPIGIADKSESEVPTDSIVARAPGGSRFPIGGRLPVGGKATGRATDRPIARPNTKVVRPTSRNLIGKPGASAKNSFTDRLPTQPIKPQIPDQLSESSELGDLFQQIEALNSIVETEGDNLDAMKNFKTTAKGVFHGVKKFYNSPAGQKTRDVVKVLIENNQNSLVNDQETSLESNLSENSQLEQSENFEAQKQAALQDLFLQIDDLNKTLEQEDGEGDNFGVLWGLKKAKQVFDVAKNVKDVFFPKK